MGDIDPELQSLRDFYADLDQDLVDAAWRQSGQDYKVAMEELAQVVRSPSAAAKIRKADSMVRVNPQGRPVDRSDEQCLVQKGEGSDAQTRPPISTSGESAFRNTPLCDLNPD